MHKHTPTKALIGRTLRATLFILPATVSAQTNPDSGISGLLNQAQATLASMATDVGLHDDEEDDEQEEEDDSDVNVLTGRESQSPLLASKQEQQADNESNDTDGTVAGTSTQTNDALQAMLDQVQDEVDRLTTQIGIEDPNDTRNTNNLPDQSISTDPDGNYVTADQLNSLKQTMYQNVESAVDTIDDTDDDTTYDAGSGLSLSDEVFSVNSGAGSYWSQTSKNDLFYNDGSIAIGTSSPAQEGFGGVPLHIYNNDLARMYLEGGGNIPAQLKFRNANNDDGFMFDFDKRYSSDNNGLYLWREYSDGSDENIAAFTQGGRIILGNRWYNDFTSSVEVHMNSDKTALQARQKGSGDIFSAVDQGGDGTVMTIQNDGKTGIGTSSPSNTLQVDGSTDVTGNFTAANNSFRVDGSGSGDFPGIMELKDGAGNARGKFVVVEDNSTSFGQDSENTLLIATDGGGQAGVMALPTPDRSDGKYQVGGIGKNETVKKVSFRPTPSNASDVAVSLGHRGTSGGGGYSSVLNVLANDLTGVGTSSPDYKLHVSTSSDGDVAGFTDTNGTCTINPTNTALNCSSDRQLKKDITTLTDNEDILNNLDQLSPVTYRWNDQNNTADKQYGLIAQDVEDVFPEFVSQGPDGYKSLSYTSFIPVNTAAINQLNNKVDKIDKDTNADFWKDSQTASSSGTSTDTDNKTLTDTFLNAVAEAVGGVVVKTAKSPSTSS